MVVLNLQAPQSISRDRELSCVSLLTPADHDNCHDNEMSTQLEQQQQLLALQEQVNKRVWSNILYLHYRFVSY